MDKKTVPKVIQKHYHVYHERQCGSSLSLTFLCYKESVREDQKAGNYFRGCCTLDLRTNKKDSRQQDEDKAHLHRVCKLTPQLRLGPTTGGL